jgi:anti-sigma regulatory factor (Ser/Thr protein kinase)
MMERKPETMFGKIVDRLEKAVEIRTYIIENVEAHSADIARLVIEKFGISRVTAVRHIGDLIKEGVLEVTGKTKDRSYKLREIVDENIDLAITHDLQEDVVWTEKVKPLLADTKENVLSICAHGLTEMLNNVIDHSQSPTARICVERNAARIRMMVIDHGIGIFRHIKEECHLEDIHHAILELAKGKLTTDPKKHSGEGVFFTSRMFDKFNIIADGIHFMRSGIHDWLFETTIRKEGRHGTTIMMTISTNASQTAKEVFDTYRAEFDEIGFSKTIIPLKLMEYEGEKLISRSQAKRLLRRVDKFKEVFLDFNGITEIGQAFADEIFRVYGNSNPQVHLHPINTSDDVRAMINRAFGSDALGKTSSSEEQA